MMKRFLLWLFMVLFLIVLLLGGVVFYFYKTADPSTLEQPTLTANEEQLSPTSAQLQMPIMGGVLFKQVSWVADVAQTDPIVVESNSLPLSISQNPDDVTVWVGQGESTLFEGSLSEYEDFRFGENGNYRFKVTAFYEPAQEGERPRTYGSYTFEFSVTVDTKLSVQLSDTVAKQGQLVTVQVLGNLGEISPWGQFGESRNLVFFQSEGKYTALIALSHNLESGDYPVMVKVGDEVFDLTLTVQYLPYEKIQLESAEQRPDASEDESAEAVEEYRTAVWPLYDAVEPQALWEGKFTPPVAGALVYAYGIGTLLPGQTISSRHSGIDYKVTGIGTAVATNAGKVVFAGNLRLCGGTVIIEHGGGLKSYLYFLDEVTVHTGDLVERGQTVGVVSGSDAGKTVHFEMRVGANTVDPKPLLEGTSGIFR